MWPALEEGERLPDWSTELTSLGASRLPDTRAGKRREEETEKGLFAPQYKPAITLKNCEVKPEPLTVEQTGAPYNTLPYSPCLLA